MESRDDERLRCAAVGSSAALGIVPGGILDQMLQRQERALAEADRKQPQVAVAVVSSR